MTIKELQESIHREYEGDYDYFESQDDDWKVRLGLIHDAIRSWVQWEQTDWNELVAFLANATDGDKTTTAFQKTYSLPTDFLRMIGVVTVNGIEYRPLKARDVKLKEVANDVNRYYYITGNRNLGFTLNLTYAPDTDGETIDYTYLKKPVYPTDELDEVEMSRPMYIVYYVVARLKETDGEGQDTKKYEDMAAQVLDDMLIENELEPYGSEFSIDYSLDTGGGFGR